MSRNTDSALLEPMQTTATHSKPSPPITTHRESFYPSSPSPTHPSQLSNATTNPPIVPSHHPANSPLSPIHHASTITQPTLPDIPNHATTTTHSSRKVADDHAECAICFEPLCKQPCAVFVDEGKKRVCYHFFHKVLLVLAMMALLASTTRD